MVNSDKTRNEGMVDVRLDEDESDFRTPLLGILDKIDAAVGDKREAEVRLVFPFMAYPFGWMDSGSVCWAGAKGRPMWAVQAGLKERGYSAIEFSINGRKYGQDCIGLTLRRAE